MRKLLRSGNGRLYFYVSAALAMAMLWRTGAAITARLSDLPVKEAPKAASNPAVLDEKNFYPVWVKQATAQAAASATTELDSLFKRPEEPKPITIPVEPDYGQRFRDRLRIDGIAGAGVFLNGSYFSVGDKLDAFTLVTADGRPIVPVLDSVTGAKVTFRLGRRVVNIPLGQS